MNEARRWSIWIDIEGFSKLWQSGTTAMQGLNAMMGGIFAIGNNTYPNDGERLFAHQFGDGFLIVADFHEDSLDRCAAIAVSLMRHIAVSGCLARGAIAEGDLSDYSGCRPRVIQNQMLQMGDDDVVALGSGLMTLLPVMGTALINANKLDAKNPTKGSVLTIETKEAHRLSLGFYRTEVPSDGELTIIDWVHSNADLIDKISSSSGINSPPPVILEKMVMEYIATHAPPALWVTGTCKFNGI